MKKNIFVLLSVIVSAFLCAFGLSACNKAPDNTSSSNESAPPINQNTSPSHSHTMSYHAKVNATCTTAGTKEYWSCSGCNKNFGDESGYTEISDLTIPATGHKQVQHAKKDPSCTEIGWVAYQTCENCDYSTYQDIPATGHSYNDGICDKCKTDTNKYLTIVNLQNSQNTTKLKINSDNHVELPDDISNNPKSTRYIRYFYDKYENNRVTDFTFTEEITLYCRIYNIYISDYTFSVANGNATIANVNTYTKNSQLVIIPRQYNGLPVTSIGEKAFWQGQMQEVIMFDEIMQIANFAFASCGGLMHITIPNSVTSIGASAFAGCSSMASINIPNSVTSIGVNAFYGCNVLCMVKIENLTSWCNIKFGDEAANPLYKANNLYYRNQRVDELIIPDDVEKIKQYAFAGGNFISIKVPNTVNSIETGAFYQCSHLEKIQLPFVGKSNNSSARFGEIFGSSEFPSSGHSSIQKFYSGTKSPFSSLIYQGEEYTSYSTYKTSFGTAYEMKYRGYYIPESITEVIITNAQKINKDCFYNCSFINRITINKTANFNGSFTKCEAEVIIV